VDRSQREHQRYAHEAAITLYTPGREICARTCNVSHGGLSACLAEEIAVGTEIELDLQLVFDDRQTEPLRLPGRIVWCTAIDDYHQLGVQFLPLDHDTAADLSLLLRYLRDRNAPREESAAVSIDERFG
jgi:hypothetical protein